MSPSAEMPQISGHIDLRPITQGLAIIPRAKSSSRTSTGEFSRRNTLKSDSGRVYAVYLLVFSLYCLGNDGKAFLLRRFSSFLQPPQCSQWQMRTFLWWTLRTYSWRELRTEKMTWRLLLKPLTKKATKLSPKESSDVSLRAFLFRSPSLSLRVCWLRCVHLVATFSALVVILWD